MYVYISLSLCLSKLQMCQQTLMSTFFAKYYKDTYAWEIFKSFFKNQNGVEVISPDWIQIVQI